MKGVTEVCRVLAGKGLQHPCVVVNLTGKLIYKQSPLQIYLCKYLLSRFKNPAIHYSFNR
jgi:hypothetical protein